MGEAQSYLFTLKLNCENWLLLSHFLSKGAYMAKKNRVIPLRIRSIKISDMAYKMIDPEFTPNTTLLVNVSVKLDDDDYYFEKECDSDNIYDDQIHLTPAGFTEVLRVLAEEIGMPMWKLDIELSEKKAKIIKQGGK